MPGVIAVFSRRRPGPAGGEAPAVVDRFQARRRRARRVAAAARASPWRRSASSARRSPRSLPRASMQARDAAEAIEVSYEPLPAVTASVARYRRGRAAGVAGGGRQHRGRDPPRRRRGRRGGLCPGRARRRAGSRQPARRRVPDRAARGARELRRGDRPHHAARQQPDADRIARRAVRRGARHSAGESARTGRRRRRRLRHEDRALPGGRRAGVRRARAEASGQLARPNASRTSWRQPTAAT